MEPRKLTRSTTDRWLTGVCGGLAEYFRVDSTLVRLGVLLLFVLTGFFPLGVLYVVAAIIMPEAPGAALPPPDAPRIEASAPLVPVSPADETSSD
jgi:phage shock protein PspC (stress-responsive transcriptional regulator)